MCIHESKKKIGIILVFITLTLAIPYPISPKNAIEATPRVLGMKRVVISEVAEIIVSIKQKHFGMMENVEDIRT